MRTLADILGGMARPLVLAVLVLIGLGLASADPAAGRAGASGFACKGIFDDPEWNRALCRLHPVRLWNTSLGEIVPGLERG